MLYLSEKPYLVRYKLLFEVETYDGIMTRMLNRVSQMYDRRPSSPIYIALQPAALEFEKVYERINYLHEQGHALTANRENLILYCKDIGLTPYPPTPSLIEGEFDVKISESERFSCNELNFKVKEFLREDPETGFFYFSLECESAGADTNSAYGNLIPIYNIDRLTVSRVSRILVPGEDEEETEELRQRYVDFWQSGAYGGNEQQYLMWVKPMPGVGGCKVIRCPEGKASRVDLYITDSLFKAPTEELIKEVQEKIHPIGVTGMPELETSGAGLAPIGHVVYVKPVEEVPINIKLNLTYRNGHSWNTVCSDVLVAFESYFSSLAEKWDSRENLAPAETTADTYISISTIDINYILHDIEGIVFYTDTEVNGSTDIYDLNFNQIPVLGEVSV